MSIEDILAICPPNSLGGSLDHRPEAIPFGTSGRRGLLKHLTQLEIFINALAELEYLQSLPKSEGGIIKGDDFFFANDLRPSSTRFDGDGGGELTQAVLMAIQVSGMKPIYLGALPTPALTSFALAKDRGSMMVTGSHIPFDRNGYKTNTSLGELLKQHENPINKKVLEVRERLYREPSPDSIFNQSGQLKSGHMALPPIHTQAEQSYIERYVNFFGASSLQGLRIAVYQHSAVGRDLLPKILRFLGAEVLELGRSETFVPIDTENITLDRLNHIQDLLDDLMAVSGPVDALVSTDGDSDRPMVLGVDSKSQKAKFFFGDLLGMVTAEFLEADAVVVPISCNDGVDIGNLKTIVQRKTRIGSPFVISGMLEAKSQGKKAVCGWEPNGGFLTGSDFYRNGHTLKELPTRDAVLPIVSVLASAKAQGLFLHDLFAQLPPRFVQTGLLKDYPNCQSRAILAHFSPDDLSLDEYVLPEGQASAAVSLLSAEQLESIKPIWEKLSELFSIDRGFIEIVKINYTDGLRLYFANHDVVHIRPSGNADELRIYALSDTQLRADQIIEEVVKDGGILQAMEELMEGQLSLRSNLPMMIRDKKAEECMSN